MTGPEHYREAERIARAAKSRHIADEEGFSEWSRSDLAALAQVHATLAHAALLERAVTPVVNVSSEVTR